MHKCGRQWEKGSKKDQIKIPNQMRVCVNGVELVGSRVPLAASVALQKNIIKSNRAQGLWGRGRERGSERERKKGE